MGHVSPRNRKPGTACGGAAAEPTGGQGKAIIVIIALMPPPARRSTWSAVFFLASALVLHLGRPPLFLLLLLLFLLGLGLVPHFLGTYLVALTCTSLPRLSQVSLPHMMPLPGPSPSPPPVTFSQLASGESYPGNFGRRGGLLSARFSHSTSPPLMMSVLLSFLSFSLFLPPFFLHAFGETAGVCES